MGETKKIIPVAWHAEKDGRGVYNSSAMLNDMFDGYNCVHFGALNGIPEAIDGAVVMVHGGRELDGIDRLNKDINNLEWVLVVAFGDEENSFPVELIEHGNKKIWIQEPLPGRHDFCDRFLINGYGHGCQKYILKCEKDLLWFFGGQCTHERRRACVDALRTIDWGGFIIETRGYHQGICLPEYYHCLCRAKIVACPSGPFSPDAARIWDTLEAGGIPILDDLSPSRPEPGFWNYVLGTHPLPVVTAWDTLPDVIEELKKGWEQRSRACQAWWSWWKGQFFDCWLAEDIEQLTGEPCTKI